MNNKIEFLESKVKELEKDKTAYEVHTANIEQELIEKQKRIEELSKFIMNMNLFDEYFKWEDREL